jgi:methylthioxylose transferase
MSEEPGVAHRTERRDLLGWLLLAAVGAILTWVAVRAGARLGTAGAPFEGHYRWRLGPASLLAPAVAAAVLAAAALGWFDRTRWPAVLLTGYAGMLAWALALAAVDGSAGFTRSLLSPAGYLTDVADVGDDPLGYLRSFAADSSRHSVATRGHPPGPVLLLWSLDRFGLRDHLALGLAVTAVGALTVPLVLAAVRDVCGELPARRYAPVLALAPYAIWAVASVDAVGGVFGAAGLLAGVRASNAWRTGIGAASWAVAAGALLGLAAMFSYAVPWLGLSLVCLYFARRRAALNVVSGIGLLAVLFGVRLAGFAWVDGLLAARHCLGAAGEPSMLPCASRVQPYRSPLWWGGISLVTLLLAAGPPLWASLRRLRNTPGWPFLAGAGAAVLSAVLTGVARGGAEHAWLAFFPWLTVAAVAPLRQAGPPVPTPLLLTGAAAVEAVVIAAILATPY